LSNRLAKSELRRELRKARRSLSAGERADADKRICANLHRLPAFNHARTVAAYLAFDGEPSVGRLFDDPRCAQTRFLVPVIRTERMTFAPLKTDADLRLNRFGIAEPSHKERVLTKTIDAVLVPLVGFDEYGNRLGMGGGFYDRHFEFLQTRKHYLRPYMIGVAYECQKTEAIPVDPWDVPLSGIVTDRRFIHVNRRR
jgi:5-formyltetrahydrofolate cyclo-ligase